MRDAEMWDPGFAKGRPSERMDLFLWGDWDLDAGALTLQLFGEGP